MPTIYHCLFTIGPAPHGKEVTPCLVVNVSDEKNAAVLIDKALCHHPTYLEILTNPDKDCLYLKQITGKRFPEGTDVPKEDLFVLEKAFLDIAGKKVPIGTV